MYESFYNLRANPFHITADPAFLYLSPSHREALAAIAYGIGRKKGFIGITGEIGVGKTTVLRSYLEGIGIPNVQPPEHIIYIFNANLSFPALLHTICRELDMPSTEGMEVYEIVNHLYTLLIELYRKQQTVVVVIDEAQNMPIETLENLRMLSNLETSRDKLIQIVLVGQPELDALLKRHELRQLRQRIAVRAQIRPLDAAESMAYLRHRLSLVTENPLDVFTPGALRAIVRSSGGAPRVINILADNALIAGFGYEKKPVTARIVREVVNDYTGQSNKSVFRLMLGTAAVALVLAGIVFGIIEFDGIQMPRYLSKASVSPPVSVSSVSVQESIRPSEAGTHPQPLVSVEPTASKKIEEEPPATISSIELTSSGPSADPPPESATAPVLSDQPAPSLWRVSKGDTLIRIAKATYGVSDEKTIRWILSRNPHIVDPDLLLTGQTIVLPAHPEF